MQMLKIYGAMAAVFFAVDVVWIGVVASGFYDRHLGHLLADEVRWGAAALFYLLFLAGLLVFAVLPGLEAHSPARAVLLGGFFGLVAYAAFDLTCLALFRDFPPLVAAVDMAWGTVLCAGVAAAGYGVGRWLGVA